MPGMGDAAAGLFSAERIFEPPAPRFVPPETPMFNELPALKYKSVLGKVHPKESLPQLSFS